MHSEGNEVYLQLLNPCNAKTDNENIFLCIHPRKVIISGVGHLGNVEERL
jgi:hypothetical protein